jgi:hypothetical protein
VVVVPAVGAALVARPVGAEAPEGFEDHLTSVRQPPDADRAILRVERYRDGVSVCARRQLVLDAIRNVSNRSSRSRCLARLCVERSEDFRNICRRGSISRRSGEERLSGRPARLSPVMLEDRGEHRHSGRRSDKGGLLAHGAATVGRLAVIRALGRAPLVGYAAEEEAPQLAEGPGASRTVARCGRTSPSSASARRPRASGRRPGERRGAAPPARP